MKKILLICAASSLLSFSSCDFLDEVTNTLNSDSTQITENEMISGLKEALIVGSKTAAFTLNDTTGQINSLNEVTGYLANELIKIALPPDAEKAFNTVSLLANTTAGSTLLATAGVDLPSYRSAIIKGLNRGAEHAAGLSVDVFSTAITRMTFTSASQVLFGADSLGATSYLQSTTSGVLTAGFKPIIGNAFNAVKVSAFSREYTVTGVWSEFAVKYNKVAGAYQGLVAASLSANMLDPAAIAAKLSLTTLNSAGILSVDSLNTDIIDFATGKALDGLFMMVGKQEVKIRRDPLAALAAVGNFVTQTISDLIRKVFTSSSVQ